MSEPTVSHACKNCGNSFTGHYCNDCGQELYHRITNHYIIHELTHAFLHADKSVLNFIRRCLIEPGTMAGEFIAGKRKVFSPLQFLVISVGLIIWLMSASDYFKGLEHIQSDQVSSLSKGFQEKLQVFNEWSNHHTNLLSFLSLPIFAFASWLFFKKQKNNYAEHFILVIFAMCQINLFTMIMLVAAIFLHLQLQAIVGITLFITLGCFTTVYSQLYDLRWYKSLWKSVLLYILLLVGQILLVFVGLAGYLLVVGM